MGKWRTVGYCTIESLATATSGGEGQVMEAMVGRMGSHMDGIRPKGASWVMDTENFGSNLNLYSSRKPVTQFMLLLF